MTDHENLKPLLCAREQSILVIGSLSVFCKIYHSSKNEQMQTNTILLSVATIFLCMLESFNMPALLKRGQSCGLYYGCILVSTIFLESVVVIENSGKSSELALRMCDDQVMFSVWLVLFLCISSQFRKSVLSIGRHFNTVILLVLTGTFMHFILNMKISTTVIVYMVTCMLCIELTSSSMTNCFTYGELLIIVELIVAFLLSFKSFPIDNNVLIIGNLVLFFVLLFLVCLLLLFLVQQMSVWSFYSCGIFLFAGLLIVLFESTTESLLQWLANFISDNWPNRQLLLLLWLIEIFVCALYLMFRQSFLGKVSTAERKLFHIFILITFIPGIRFDMPLLFLCSIGATCLLLLLELMRALEIPPLANLLGDRFALFVGPQDSGRFIMTPIYLMLGQSLPIWAACFQDKNLLTPEHTKIPIAVYSGILSVGLGDTAASVIGSKFGTHKWLGTNKTIEGTLAAFVAQVVVACFFSENFIQFCAIATAIATISLLEAFTSQIDNLVLPAYMYFLLNAIAI